MQIDWINLTAATNMLEAALAKEATKVDAELMASNLMERFSEQEAAAYVKSDGADVLIASPIICKYYATWMQGIGSQAGFDTASDQAREWISESMPETLAIDRIFVEAMESFILSANEHYRKEFGCTPEEIITKSSKTGESSSQTLARLSRARKGLKGVEPRQ